MLQSGTSGPEALSNSRFITVIMFLCRLCYSNRNKTQPTCTCPTCPCPWTSRSWRTSSSPSDKSSPLASSETRTAWAEVSASPGQCVCVYSATWTVVQVSSNIFLPVCCVNTFFFFFPSLLHLRVSVSGWSLQRSVMLWSLTLTGSSLNLRLECWVIKNPLLCRCRSGECHATFPSVGKLKLGTYNVFPGASEPLLCKFADGGQKKRLSQSKYVPNGRNWTRDAEVRLVSPSLVLYSLLEQ